MQLNHSTRSGQDHHDHLENLLSAGTRQALQELTRLQVQSQLLQKQFEGFLETHQRTLESSDRKLDLTNEIDDTFGNVTFITFELSEQLIRADLDRPGK